MGNIVYRKVGSGDTLTDRQANKQKGTSFDYSVEQHRAAT